MDRLQWIRHLDSEILFIEFRGGSPEEGAATLEDFVQAISEKKADSVLFLADLKQARYWPSLALNWQKRQELIKSRCKRVAVVGLHGTIQLAVQTFLTIAQATGRPIAGKVKFFDAPEAAKNWLTQAQGHKADN